MSDEELVKRLRWMGHENTDAGADRIEQLINLNEALVELLDAARADAKEAEAYAEELARDLVKADNDIDDLKTELAKAVEALRAVAQHEASIFFGPDAEKNRRASWRGVMRKVKAALAEIEGKDALEAMIDKPAPAPDKVGYSQAKRDLCLFLDPDLASADAWGWADDSLFAAALARLTTPKPDQIDTVARSTLAEIEGEKG